MPKSQAALFLRHLWATDGSVHPCAGSARVASTTPSTSRRLLDDVSRLLLRFGISARIHTVTAGPHRAQYTLDISGRDDQLRFLQEIGAHGERSLACGQLLARLDSVKADTNIDTIPTEVWQQVRMILRIGMSHREFAATVGTQVLRQHDARHAPSRQRLSQIASVLDSADLELSATNDVLWMRSCPSSASEQDVLRRHRPRHT